MPSGQYLPVPIVASIKALVGAGISAKAIGRLLGISASAVNSYWQKQVHPNVKPDPEALKRIAAAIRNQQ